MPLGLITLLGAGVGIPASGKTHAYLGERLPPHPRIAVVETPAGFELNSGDVAARVGEYIAQRLQNLNPRIEVVAARKKGTPFSPDAHDVVAPILAADEIVLGPGSPTYGARQLRDSLALDYMKARQWRGGILLLSSSATASLGRLTLPVYEIYKVGEEPHWKEGADYFADYGLNLTIVPHWNNKDGGKGLDTSRCYIGRARFDPLLAQLPAGHTLLGLDDHTAAVLDFNSGEGTVVGPDTVTIIRDGRTHVISSGDTFALDLLGPWRAPDPGALPATVWAAADAAWAARLAADAPPPPPDAVVALADQRLAARNARDWPLADSLRDQITALGWHVKDTAEGYELEENN